MRVKELKMSAFEMIVEICVPLNSKSMLLVFKWMTFQLFAFSLHRSEIVGLLIHSIDHTLNFFFHFGILSDETEPFQVFRLSLLLWLKQYWRLLSRLHSMYRWCEFVSTTSINRSTSVSRVCVCAHEYRVVKFFIFSFFGMRFHVPFIRNSVFLVSASV